MRAYFFILSGLLLVAVFVSYKIAATLAFDKIDEQAHPLSGYASNENGTSACFEKRYSPQIRACGGLLQYSPPTVAYQDDEKPKHVPAAKRKHLSGRVLTSRRSTKAGVPIGKIRPPSGPSHSDMASF